MGGGAGYSANLREVIVRRNSGSKKFLVGRRRHYNQENEPIVSREETKASGSSPKQAALGS